MMPDKPEPRPSPSLADGSQAAKQLWGHGECPEHESVHGARLSVLGSTAVAWYYRRLHREESVVKFCVALQNEKV